jgi:glutamine amidotransferase
VVLLDSGGANLGSVQAAFARLGVEAPVTTDPATIAQATHVVLPGVGAAAACMARLRENGLDQLIPRLTQPLLGICVGMQLLFERSEESDTKCLGLLAGGVRRLRPSPGIRIPHMGWNRLNATVRRRIH